MSNKRMVVLLATLVLSFGYGQKSHAAANGKGNSNGNANGSSSGSSNGSGNNGNPGCQNGCPGNSGNGNGNTGPGNQGNDGTNGNAGGAGSGSSNGNSNGNANGNSNGNANGNSNGNANGNSNGNANGNSNGNANGNSNGNANGNSNGNSDGNANGNSNGNANGNSNGNSDGNANGNSNGNANGNSNGNSDGNANGNSDGNGNGNSDGNGNGTQPQPEKPHRELKAKLLPAFFLNFDYGTKILNLAPHNAAKAKPSLVAEYNPVLDTLVYGDASRGFQVTKFSTIAGGVGANVLFYFVNVTGIQKALWATVGLIPYAGADSVSIRTVKTLEQAFNAPALGVPSKASDLGAWAQGDSLSYASNGGLIFSSSIGVAAIGVGNTFVAQGSFQIYIEKMSRDTAYVRVTDVSVTNLSLQASVAVVTVSASQFKQADRGMSFLINVNDKIGAKAFNDLIKGNVVAVQKLARDGGPVKRYEKLAHQQVGRTTSFFFGLPIIAYQTWSAGKIYDVSDVQAFYNNTKSNIQYGIYLKEKRSRLFDTHASTTEAFYGGVFRTSDLSNRALTKGTFGQYVWTAEDDSSSAGDIRSAIGSLVQKTGLVKELWVNVPSLKNLQYSRVGFQLTFNEDQTNLLTERFASTSEAQIVALVQRKSNAYFMKGTDAYGVCYPVERENGSCQGRINSETRWAASDMRRAAVAMIQARRASKDKEFAMAYADFGKAMLKNPFLFQTVLDLAGRDVEMNYSIGNTYLSSYQVQFKTTGTPGRYTKKFVNTSASGAPSAASTDARNGATTVPSFGAPASP